jgi:hypothetical protein
VSLVQSGGIQFNANFSLALNFSDVEKYFHQNDIQGQFDVIGSLPVREQRVTKIPYLS